MKKSNSKILILIISHVFTALLGGASSYFIFNFNNNNNNNNQKENQIIQSNPNNKGQNFNNSPVNSTNGDVDISNNVSDTIRKGK